MTNFLKFIFILSFLILFGNQVFAQDQCTSGTCCDTTVSPKVFRLSTYVCATWTEYGCPWGTSCGQDVGKRTNTQYCSGTSADCNGIISYGDWSVTTDCNSWETCNTNTYTCNCSVSSCLSTPTNPSPSNGEQNVKLPVTLKWNAVNGASSYRYKIDGVLESFTTSNSTTVDAEGTCLLKSNKTYQWGVKSCCDSNGANCGDNFTNWNFKTSLAPQTISPKNNTTDVPIPVTLDWCDVESAQSYYLRFYKDGKRYFGPVLYPLIVTKEDDALNSELSLGLDFLTKKTTYEWEAATCFEENGLKCGKDCLKTEDGDKCGEYGQRWKFTTGDIALLIPQLITPKYNPGPPEEIPIVNFSNKLSWKSLGGEGVFSYRYQIKKDEEVIVDKPAEFLGEVPFNIFWHYLDFDTVYSWRVKSCWDEEGENCEDKWSEEWKFKTTGAPPSLVYPGHNAINISIPVKFDWGDVSGAGSYYYEVSTTSDFSRIVATSTVESSEALIDYPKLKMLTDYWWQVKTCSDKAGNVCGGWSVVRKFTTFKLTSPTNPSPADGGNFSTYEKYISWNPVAQAKTYQYTIDYASVNPPPDEKNEECVGLAGTKIIPPTITSPPVFLTLKCLGAYNWSVRACLDKNCQEVGDWSSPPWSFNFVQPAPVGESGLVPCGRITDYPDTPWNERENCQLKHIFILLKNIIDLLLWRIGVIILGLLAVASGVIYYFSMGAPATIVNVRAIWRAAGKGYLIIFLAWIIINLVLAILGYQIGVFGKWWEIKF